MRTALTTLGMLALLGACNPDDTGDTSDTGDTADTNDTTDTNDTSDTGDTGEVIDDTLVAVDNYPVGECTTGSSSFGGVKPSTTSEVGAWAAARLSPPSTPFTVEQVLFSMKHENLTPCDAKGAFQMKLFVVSGTTPPDGDGTTAPAADATIDFPAITTDPDGARELIATLSTPITLESGESLVIAVDSYAGACFGACVTTANAPADRNYWSTPADAEDWDWVLLSSFGGNYPRYQYWASMYGTED